MRLFFFFSKVELEKQSKMVLGAGISLAVFILYLVHSHILKATVTLSRPSYYVYFWRQFYPSCFLKKHLVYWELRLSMMQQSSIVLLLLYCLDFRILKEFVFLKKIFTKLDILVFFTPIFGKKIAWNHSSIQNHRKFYFWNPFLETIQYTYLKIYNTP